MIRIRVTCIEQVGTNGTPKGTDRILPVEYCSFNKVSEAVAQNGGRMLSKKEDNFIHFIIFGKGVFYVDIGKIDERDSATEGLILV